MLSGTHAPNCFHPKIYDLISAVQPLGAVSGDGVPGVPMARITQLTRPAMGPLSASLPADPGPLPAMAGAAQV